MYKDYLLKELKILLAKVTTWFIRITSYFLKTKIKTDWKEKFKPSYITGTPQKMFSLRQVTRMYSYRLSFPFNIITILKVIRALLCFKSCNADTLRHSTLQPRLPVAFSVQVQLFFFLPLLFCPV